MLRRSVVVLAVLFTAGLTADGARAATLYSTLDQPSDVQGTSAEYVEGAQRVAQAFTPAVNGNARLVSLFGQTTFGTGTGHVQVSIFSNVAGKPGAQLATGQGTITETTGASPTCVALNAAPALSTSQSYWTVVKGVDKGVNWLFSRQQSRQVLFDNAGTGAWAQLGVQKTFSLRVEDGAACGPDITTNPAAGVVVGDMYAKPGGTSFQTLFAGNAGNQDLTLTGGSFSGPNAAAFRLLKGEPAGPANQPYTFPRTIGASRGGGELLYVVCDGSAPDGLRKATFTLTTNDPDEASVSWPVECLVDVTPPTVQFTQTPTGQAGWWTTAPANLQVRGVDPESGNRVKRIFCTDSKGPALDFPSGSITTFQLTGDGVHTLDCRATDVANNTTPAGTMITTVRIDTQAPQVTAGAGPPAITNLTSAAFAFGATDAASGVALTECRLDGGAFTACTSPASAPGLGDAAHAFAVRARDVAGNVGLPASWSWRVDLSPPDTTLSGGPAVVTTATTAAFTAAGTDPGGAVAGLRCSLDDAPFAACPAPLSYAGLTDGHHTLRVAAVDNATNVDPSPAVRAWDVDRKAPTAKITSAPPALTAATSGGFAFAEDSPGAAHTDHFECRIDGGAFATCASPYAATGLQVEQAHTFEVRAIDTLGNVQAPATAYTWSISTSAPAVADPATTPPAGQPPAAGLLPVAAAGVGVLPPGPVRDSTKPVVTQLRVKGGKLTFRLSEAAKVAVAVQKVAPRGRKAKSTTLKVSGRAGGNTVRLPKKLAHGRYRVTVTAVDAAGNRAQAVTAAFSLRR